MAGQQRFWCPKSYVYGAVSENLFVPAMDTLRAVIFRARQLFLCCPVNGGLTYRLPNAKFVHSGNFGGCGFGTPFIVTGGLGLSATGPDGRDTGNLNPVN